MMIGSASKRCKIDSPDRCAIPFVASGLVLQLDQIFGQFDHRHVLRRDLGDDPPAIEHDQAIGDLMHMRQIVLDIDAGAAGLL